MKTDSFTRRQFLRAAGVTVALPWLETLSRAAAPTVPQRFVCVANPFGMIHDAFFPSEEGLQAALPVNLGVFEPLRGKFTVFSNLDHIRQVCRLAAPNQTSRFPLGIESNRPLLLLVEFVNKSLLEAEYKYFLCYRTLYDVLRLRPEYHNKKVIDLCVHQEVILVLIYNFLLINSI